MYSGWDHKRGLSPKGAVAPFNPLGTEFGATFKGAVAPFNPLGTEFGATFLKGCYNIIVMSLSEGLNWIDNKAKKIKEVLLTSSPFQLKGYGGYDSKEGFGGILGPSIIDITNEQETARTNGLTTSLQVDLENYATANQALQEKTNKYLNSVPDTQGRNYNIFINKAAGHSDIESTLVDKGKCVEVSSVLAGGLNDAGAPFYGAYPNNFSSVVDANDACKLWAADAGMPNFAIGKSADNSTYTCHVGSFSGNPSKYSVPQVAYVIASSNDATLGGLFLDGTIGVYNADASDNIADTSAATAAGTSTGTSTGTGTGTSSTGTSTSRGATYGTGAAETVVVPGKPKNSNHYNVKLMTGSAVPNGYAMCDKFIGGALVAQSVQATLGANCSGDVGTPFSARYVTMWNNPNNPDSYLQISQIAVYSYSDGKIINVAPLGTATDGWGNKGFGGSSTALAIDGNLSNKTVETEVYRSLTGQPGTYWELDLGQEYPVFQVTYYNWAGGDGSRSNGGTMVVQDGEKSKSVKRSTGKGNVQVFNIQEKDAKPVPTYSTPHLDNTGVSQSWGTSWKYAKERGGRLGTWAEVLAYIAANDNLRAQTRRYGYGYGESWLAVTNGHNDQNDMIQHLPYSSGNAYWDAMYAQGSSHVKNFGLHPWWQYGGGGDVGYNKAVFWMGP